MITDHVTARLLALSAPTESLVCHAFRVWKKCRLPNRWLSWRLLLSCLLRRCRKIDEKDKDLFILKRQPAKKREEIKALGIKGLAFQKELKRHYQMGTCFAHVIWFHQYLTAKRREGLELSREDSLHENDGAKSGFWRDNKEPISSIVWDSPRNSDPEKQAGHGFVFGCNVFKRLAYDELNKQ